MDEYALEVFMRMEKISPKFSSMIRVLMRWVRMSGYATYYNLFAMNVVFIFAEMSTISCGISDCPLVIFAMCEGKV